MQAFATLLDSLSTAPARTAKLRLLGDHFANTPDPDRGWALAALTGGLGLAVVKPALIRSLIEDRVDPVLFRLSYDYVGDLAETVALLWPEGERADPPGLTEVVETLRRTSRADAAREVAALLDRLDASGRFALLKLATGAMRVGAGARLVRLALAQRFGVPVEGIEEAWHGLAPPYLTLFAWLEGRAGRPEPGSAALFRPLMLAHPLETPEAIDLRAYAAEWKWDGIRVQAVVAGGVRRLFSRDGNEISASFPDVVAGLGPDLVLDGELLVRGRDGAPASFNALQKRLNRRAPDTRLLAEAPAFVRAYDLLFDGTEDIRALPWTARRARLEAMVGQLDPARFDLSPIVPVDSVETLARLRADPPDPVIEGLMLKRRDSPYVAGRVTGLWWKWKKAPMSADCVLMYAQRGHGKRSSFYSDFTFGAWDGDALVPVGKAYFGFTDAELRWLDKWVRDHTIGRFGPVREVEKALVLEIAFEGVQESSRHRSGLALRFPRIARIRADKPASEADTVEAIAALGGLGRHERRRAPG
ncbi:cisplatin damage response ATP-dependent DNA ligase [Thermaurantiacus sp.]